MRNDWLALDDISKYEPFDGFIDYSDDLNWEALLDLPAGWDNQSFSNFQNPIKPPLPCLDRRQKGDSNLAIRTSNQTNTQPFL